ncbi:hypothetical protein NDN16_18375 [Aureimonas altamirensis]|uniref:DUF7673 family protein n=1 Tax=Aureimonas altamirensis TaxID=370622 RepID=UPI00203666C9|nr:hypothetical protein [Aureimonas altamirensis]MCM2505636.1 hypothetical protein [Aureimonas altamirensis]
MTPQERAAVERLIELAKSDTGQARRAADFLLAWWNATDLGGFNPIDAGNVDEAIAEDMMTVFAFVARAPSPVYPDEYERDIRTLIQRWRPDVWARSQETA